MVQSKSRLGESRSWSLSVPEISEASAALGDTDASPNMLDLQPWPGDVSRAFSGKSPFSTCFQSGTSALAVLQVPEHLEIKDEE